MLTTIAELQNWSQQQSRAGQRIGLVPTMGALHEGHLSLVRASQKLGCRTVVSIFVNPTQFAPGEDFEHYPRPLEQDLRLLETVGSPEVFVPSVTEMYTDTFDATVHIGGVTEMLEGEARPTHFDGVATVVLKLLLASRADEAFFGQKDYQQTLLVKKMARDLNLATKIVVCPIVRETDGLALSSRNQYLTPRERQVAPLLFQTLAEGRRLITLKKVQDAYELEEKLRAKIATTPEFSLDYLVVRHPETLRPVQKMVPTLSEVVILVAAKLGTTRLIDNMLVSVPKTTVPNTPF